MPRYLMTHSLLSSWIYTMRENPYEDATTERDPYGEFLKVLGREPTETTEAMRKGIDFEDLVTSITRGEGAPDDRWYTAAYKVAGLVSGGLLQCKASKEIQAGGLTLVLYGRLDSLKAGVIRDIKFTSHYDRGKYFDSTQHPTYFELVPEAFRFEYIVSNGTEVWTEPYDRAETASIVPTIEDFLGWLRGHDLMSVYKEKWVSK